MKGEDAYWVDRHLDELKCLLLYGDRAAMVLGPKFSPTGYMSYYNEALAAQFALDELFRDDPAYHKDDGLGEKFALYFLDAALARAEAAQFCMRRSYDPNRDRQVADRIEELIGRLYEVKHSLEDGERARGRRADRQRLLHRSEPAEEA